MGDVTPDPAAGSALARIGASRKKALSGLHLDLKVPGLDPEVYVRFRPIQQFELDEVNERAAASKDPDRTAIANATILSRACLGVFGIVDGKPEGSPDAWPRFDRQLAEALELTEGGAEPTTVEIVRALYLIDGALINTAEKLSAWSFPAVQSREDQIAGN